MPEFICNPSLGEVYQDTLSLKGNPQPQRDWYEKVAPADKEKYLYTVAHWAYSEARFRRHFSKVPENYEETMIPLEDILWRITQNDVLHRRFLDESHRSFIPNFGVYTRVEGPDGALRPVALSRQLVLFCVERRKNWRLLQGRAGITNLDYLVQKKILKGFDDGEIPREALCGGKVRELVEKTREELKKG